MSITLSYLSDSVELTNQDLKDVAMVDLPIDFGVSMNSTFYTYKKTHIKRNFTLSFTNARQSILDDLSDLFIAAAGERINLLDYNSDNWSVLVIVPFNVTYERYLNTVCKDAGGFTLQFTGEKV